MQAFINKLIRLYKTGKVHPFIPALIIFILISIYINDDLTRHYWKSGEFWTLSLPIAILKFGIIALLLIALQILRGLYLKQKAIKFTSSETARNLMEFGLMPNEKGELTGEVLGFYTIVKPKPDRNYYNCNVALIFARAVSDLEDKFLLANYQLFMADSFVAIEDVEVGEDYYLETAVKTRQPQLRQSDAVICIIPIAGSESRYPYAVNIKPKILALINSIKKRNFTPLDPANANLANQYYESLNPYAFEA